MPAIRCIQRRMLVLVTERLLSRYASINVEHKHGCVRPAVKLIMQNYCWHAVSHVVGGGGRGGGGRTTADSLDAVDRV